MHVDGDSRLASYHSTAVLIIEKLTSTSIFEQLVMALWMTDVSRK